MPERRNPLRDGGDPTLHAISDVLDVGMLGVDSNLVIVLWNQWLEHATGKSAADVLGKPLIDVVPTLRPNAVAAIERAVAGSTVILSHALHGFFLELPPPAGFASFERMQQNVRILPVKTPGCTTFGAIAFIQDVTERVAREEELRMTMEEAQRANRAKSDFLAAMSHELRTPIGAMSGYVDLLVDGIFGEITITQREPLTRIRSLGTHLHSIVEQLLSFARIDAGHEVVNRVGADPSALVRDALLTIEPLVAKKGLALECGALPAGAEIQTDPVKVRQILINLLGNAVKFTEAGSIFVGVSMAAGDTIAFAVRDTGPGISADDRARIFEPFVRVERALTRTGTGLGLAVSRKLARLLGGDLTLVSEPGAGATFTLTIPR